MEIQFGNIHAIFQFFYILGRCMSHLHARFYTLVMIFSACRIGNSTLRYMQHFLSSCMQCACDFVVLLFLAGGATYSFSQVSYESNDLFFNEIQAGLDGCM